MAASKSRYCEKCHSTMSENNFYGSNNLEKYPEGKLNVCKKCLTMHVNNYDPETYLWILQETDVPYIPDEWNKILMRKQQRGDTLTGTSVIGRYLSLMKLGQNKKYRWKDSQLIQDLQNKKIEETMANQGYSQAEIDETIKKGVVAIPKAPIPIPEYEVETSAPGQEPMSQLEPEPIEDDYDLTDEDKKYLTLKWGKSYRPHEWIYLEKFYNDMITSYDIQSAGHIDTLKMLCKTSLKCNQLVDIGDVEGFQKMSKVYDMLMKSGNFTALQNKADSSEFVDSIGELVEICEKEGFIPRYYTDKPNDRVDETLLDLKQYTYSLVTEEMNLGNLIENAVKQMQREEEKEEDLDIDLDNLTLDDLDSIKEEELLNDKDFSDFLEFNEEESEDW